MGWEVWGFQELGSLSSATISIIGAGRIGSTFISFLKGKVKKIIATGRRPSTLSNAERLGALPLSDNGKAASLADIIIISVKPHHFPDIALSISDYVRGKIVVSVVAGVRLSTLREALPGAEVYRAMPNINALIGHSTTAIAETGDGVETPHRNIVEELFKSMGTVYWIPEEWIDVWTGLIGSGPAYLAEIIDGLVLGAVSMGVPRDVVYKAILDTMKATASVLEARSIHPAELRDEVTTPAGTTIYGLKVLEAKGVKSALMELVEAASIRGKELGEIIDSNVRSRLGLKS
ncbi:MAG: pyrroline-5-carboxylate reductase [Desulfurococcales archaeon]|nr:pyrroline-5-carboxylate reductase [Desulfurococcales archaeon]